MWDLTPSECGIKKIWSRWQIKIKREEIEVRMKQELESKQAKANALRQSHLQEVGVRDVKWTCSRCDPSLSSLPFFPGPAQGWD